MSILILTCIGPALAFLGALFGVATYLFVELRSARRELHELRSAHRHAREQLRATKNDRDRYRFLAERLVTADTVEDRGMQ